jgi:hypothetical protein
MLYTACETGKRPKNMSLRQFIHSGEQFCHHLGTHHGIEERHIFPVCPYNLLGKVRTDKPL